MKTSLTLAAIGCLLLSLSGPSLAAEAKIASPGFPPTVMDAQGCLVEDWGKVAVKLQGEGLAATPSSEVESVKLDSVIPAAVARTDYGAARLTLTAFRAPAWPSGIDVLTVQIDESQGREQSLTLCLPLPENVRLGSRTASVGGRTVLLLPTESRRTEKTRDWGWADDATALPGWAHPETDCAPGFKNIRAGLGGVPILYYFKVPPKSAATVVLGFCESHWAESGQRLLVCQVEGAKPQPVDPVARWGQHKPGALQFAAQDENGDGRLEIAVLPASNAPDQNPILNLIWIFPPDTALGLDRVIAGKMDAMALKVVDVGGPGDQSLYDGGNVEYQLTLPPNGKREFTFLLASPGASLPAPDRSAWTPQKLRLAAARTWREWTE